MMQLCVVKDDRFQFPEPRLRLPYPKFAALYNLVCETGSSVRIVAQRIVAVPLRPAEIGQGSTSTGKMPSCVRCLLCGCCNVHAHLFKSRIGRVSTDKALQLLERIISGCNQFFDGRYVSARPMLEFFGVGESVSNRIEPIHRISQCFAGPNFGSHVYNILPQNLPRLRAGLFFHLGQLLYGRPDYDQGNGYRCNSCERGLISVEPKLDAAKVELLCRADLCLCCGAGRFRQVTCDSECNCASYNQEEQRDRQSVVSFHRYPRVASLAASQGFARAA